MIRVRTLTLENRKKIELMWGNKESPVKIAAELGISPCTVDTELKRRQCLKAGVDMTLDKNLRPAYSAERGGPYTKEICGTVVAVQKNVLIKGARGMSNLEKTTASPGGAGRVSGFSHHFSGSFEGSPVFPSAFLFHDEG